MSPENVFKFCRAYKLYYQGTYDFKKYKGQFKMPPLIKQPERRFYYRIAQKLQDDQIHALFTIGYFFHPRAYVTDFATPEAFSAALAFASRAENGRTLMEHDLYELAKRLKTMDLDTWLYGEIVGGRTRTALPECVQDLINGELPPDLACALLLIPQPTLQYHWSKEFGTGDFFGASEWVERLKKLDGLLYLRRASWRIMTHELAKEFWTSLKVKTLAPKQLTKPEAVLF